MSFAMRFLAGQERVTDPAAVYLWEMECEDCGDVKCIATTHAKAPRKLSEWQNKHESECLEMVIW